MVVQESNNIKETYTIQSLTSFQMAFSQTMDKLIDHAFDSPLETCTISLALASLGYLTIRGVHASFKKQNFSYPPGPSRQPFIGAFSSFPSDHFYHRFSEWAKTYGTLS
jgi:hypothetical protein